MCNRISVATQLYQSATFVSQPHLESRRIELLTPHPQQLFPGFKYSDPNLKSCILEGISLKHGKHLGNLGSSKRIESQQRIGLTSIRFNPPLRFSNCGYCFPPMEIRTKTSSSRTEVRWIASLTAGACTDTGPQRNASLSH
jgi:hypothetical protein